MATVHSVTSNSSVLNAECTHFAKIMQNGAVKLGFLTKYLSKILEFGIGVNSIPKYYLYGQISKFIYPDVPIDALIARNPGSYFSFQQWKPAPVPIPDRSYLH